MDFTLIQKYMPAGQTLWASLGDAQKQYLNTHVDKLAPFMLTDRGREALLLFLAEFADFTMGKHEPKLPVENPNR